MGETTLDPTGAAAARVNPAARLAEWDWDAEFPSRRVSVQFNHAAVCPLPARARDAMAAYGDEMATRGSLAWRAWGREVATLKERAARLVGASDAVGGAASLSVVPNTTWGLNVVAQGFDWKPGDSVVTTATDFPSNQTPWLALKRRGIVVRRIPTRDGAFTAAEVADACDATTRLVSLSAVAFHTGFRAPIEEVGAFCRSHGIVFGLDAIQAVGVIPVDVVAAKVDFFSADGHKWMLGPEGAGLLFTTPELRSRLAAPGGWMNYRHDPADYAVPEEPKYLDDGRRFEVGAPPTPGVYALSASLALLLEIGMETTRKRIDATLGVLLDGLPRVGFTPITFPENGSRPAAGILAALPPAHGQSAHWYMKKLEERDLVVTARCGFLRLSPHVGNDEAEAVRVLRALEEAS